MNLKKYKLKDLKPTEYNPRQLTETQYKDLKASLDKFGLVEPLIVNEYKGREGVIVGGHQRYRLLKELGYEEVDVSIVKLPLKAEQELNLRLNKNNGEWDYDLLSNFDIEFLREVGFDDHDLDILSDDELIDYDEMKEDLKKEIADDENVTVYKFTVPKDKKGMIDDRLRGYDSDFNVSFILLCDSK